LLPTNIRRNGLNFKILSSAKIAPQR